MRLAERAGSIAAITPATPARATGNGSQEREHQTVLTAVQGPRQSRSA